MYDIFSTYTRVPGSVTIHNLRTLAPCYGELLALLVYLTWDDLLEKDQCLAKVNLEDLLETNSGKRQEYWLVAIQAAREASRLQGQLQANAHRQDNATRESLHTPLETDCCVISLSPRHHHCCLHNFVGALWLCDLHPHRLAIPQWRRQTRLSLELSSTPLPPIVADCYVVSLSPCYQSHLPLYRSVVNPKTLL